MNDRRKSLQPRSFPLMRRTQNKVIFKEQRRQSERRLVGLELSESNLSQAEFQKLFKK